MQHNINMVKYNLNYARNELNNAFDNLSNFAKVNNRALNESNVGGVKNKLDNQLYILTKYIIPAVNKM